jgi:hypothetical protein
LQKDPTIEYRRQRKPSKEVPKGKKLFGKENEMISEEVLTGSDKKSGRSHTTG